LSNLGTNANLPAFILSKSIGQPAALCVNDTGKGRELATTVRHDTPAFKHSPHSCSTNAHLSVAVLVLLLRFSISQMDVPTRQSYTMAVVPAEERSATGGFTGVARTTGAAISPLLAGFLFARPSWISAPFYVAGTLKIVYDLLLYHSFRRQRPPEEQ